MSTFTLCSYKDRVKRLSQGSLTTFRELITEALQEGSNRCLFEKSAFLFVDQITILDEALYVDDHKWLREVEGAGCFSLTCQEVIH